MTCVGARTIARVDVTLLERPDGKPDRKVIIVRDCGHSYYWGASLTAPLPIVGAPCWHCPEGNAVHSAPETPEGPTIFAERPARRRKARV